jgi:hypothetical protein
LTVNLQRIPSTITAGEVNVQQIKALCKARKDNDEGLAIDVADAKCRTLPPRRPHGP